MPDITNTLKENPLVSDGKLTVSFSLFGYGLYNAWLLMGIQTAIITPLSSAGSIFTSAAHMIPLVVQFVLLLYLAIHLKKTEGRGHPGRRMIWVSSIVGFLSIVALFGATHIGGTASTVLNIVGWIFFGIAAAGATFIWVRIFSVVKSSELCLYISGSLILCAAVVYVLCYLPTLVSVILTALLPWASLALSAYARKHVDYVAREAKHRELFKDEHDVLPVPVVRLLIAIAIIALIFAAVFNPMATRGGHGFESSGGFMLLPLIVAGLVIIGATLLTARLDNLSKLYRTMLPLMMIALLLVPFFNNGFLNVAAVLGSLSFQLFDVICWVLLLDFALHTDIPPLKSLIFGRIFYTVGILLGNIAGTYMAYNELFKDKQLLTIICLGSAVILVVVTTIILRENELFATAGVRPRAAAGAAAPVAEVALPMPAPEEVFKYKANRIAERYELTNRERDVFMLLSKGRSNKLIEERLVISSHTVDSHVTHIYRKCGVHSRQEIMDLIEQERVDMQELARELAAKESAEA